MVKFWSAGPAHEPLEFEDFIWALEVLGADVFDQRHHEHVVRLLQRLYHNRGFLEKILIDHLDLDTLKSGENTYTSQVFILHRSTHFMIRLPLWDPPRGLAGEEIFAYDLAHDHNFDFYTLGYDGPGYRTQVCEYDYDEVAGFPGEAVTLKNNRLLQLLPGSVMFFQASRDVHLQFPPEGLSLSLNIMPSSAWSRNQYAFDIPTSTLLGKITTDPRPLLSSLALESDSSEIQGCFKN